MPVFIIGSIPECVNISNLEEALMSNDAMENIDFYIRVDYMPLNGKRRISTAEDRKKSVRCVQIYTSYSKIPKARKQLNFIWDSQNKLGDL